MVLDAAALLQEAKYSRLPKSPELPKIKISSKTFVFLRVLGG